MMSSTNEKVLSLKPKLYVVWVKEMEVWEVYSETNPYVAIRFFNTMTKDDAKHMADIFCEQHQYSIADFEIVVEEASTRHEALNLWQKV